MTEEMQYCVDHPYRFSDDVYEFVLPWKYGNVPEVIDFIKRLYPNYRYYVEDSSIRDSATTLMIMKHREPTHEDKSGIQLELDMGRWLDAEHS